MYNSFMPTFIIQGPSGPVYTGAAGDTVTISGSENTSLNGEHVITSIYPDPIDNSDLIALLEQATLKAMEIVPTGGFLEPSFDTMTFRGQPVEICRECGVMFAYNPPTVKVTNPFLKCSRCIKPEPPVSTPAPKDFVYVDPDLLWENDRG